MSKNVAMPDGSVVEFPDTMSDDDIGAVISKQQAPPEQPGFFKRLGQSVGIPTSMEELEAAQPSTAEKIGGPAVTAGKMLYNYGKNAYQGAKEALQEGYEAGYNIGEGQPVLPNVGKASAAVVHGTLQAVPFVGPPIETAGQDIAQGNYAGAAGGLTGVIGQVAAPKIIEGAGKIKDITAPARQSFAENSITKLIKPSANDLKFGKDPAGAIIREQGIQGSTLEDIGPKIYQRAREVGQSIDERLQTPEAQAKKI